jgi:anthranilate synthase/aminodeoxychorismate synthase-like glutamine amidotransferase
VNNAGAGDVTPAVRVLLLDNRDSFTWNLAQAFQELGAGVAVLDAGLVNAAGVLRDRPDVVCVGPGPRAPDQHLLDLVRDLTGRVPLFGVCLGMQAIVQAFGGDVVRARAPIHGKRDPVEHDGEGVFRGLPSPLWVMRYHSLVVDRVPARFAISARDRHGQPMALRGPGIEAVQFHPESIGTAGGMHILANAIGVSAPRRDRRGAVPPATSAGPGHAEALYRGSP